MRPHRNGSFDGFVLARWRPVCFLPGNMTIQCASSFSYWTAKPVMMKCEYNSMWHQCWLHLQVKLLPERQVRWLLNLNYFFNNGQYTYFYILMKVWILIALIDPTLNHATDSTPLPWIFTLHFTLYLGAPSTCIFPCSAINKIYSHFILP